MPGHGEAALAHLCRCLFAYFILPRTLSMRERPEKYSAAAARQKTPEREKALRQGEIYRGNSFPEGEIVAIVTVIELDFIVIIIIIISTTSTVTTIISTPSCCSFLGFTLYNS